MMFAKWRGARLDLRKFGLFAPLSRCIFREQHCTARMDLQKRASPDKRASREIEVTKNLWQCSWLATPNSVTSNDLKNTAGRVWPSLGPQIEARPADQREPTYTNDCLKPRAVPMPLAGGPQRPRRWRDSSDTEAQVRPHIDAETVVVVAHPALCLLLQRHRCGGCTDAPSSCEHTVKPWR